MNNAVTALCPTTAVDDDLQAPDWRALLTGLAPSEVLQDSDTALGEASSPPISGANKEALQHRIAADFASGNIGGGFGNLPEPPLCLRNPGSAAIVWSHWYGSQRQVTRVMELLLKVRSPETAAFTRNAQRSNPTMVLSMLLGKLLFPYLDAINAGTPDTQDPSQCVSRYHCEKRSSGGWRQD